MLYFVFKRVWQDIFAYVLFAYGFWVLYERNVISEKIIYVLFAFATYRCTRTIYLAIQAERLIYKYGDHAPSIRSLAPWGLDTLAMAMYYFSKWRNHEFWYYVFSFNKNAHNPWTVEDVTAGQRIIFTADEENIKAILATKFSDYGKGEQFRKEWKDFLGLSIFTTDGEMWHNSRTLLRPTFIKDRVSDLHIFEERIQILLPMLAGAHTGAAVRMDDLFHRYALDASTAFLFGKSVDSLRNDQTVFAEAFQYCSLTQGRIARAGPLNFLVPKKAFHEALSVLNNFVNTYVEQTLQLPQDELEKTNKSDEGYTFLHALASHTRDRQFLRDSLVAVLLAGRDTTAVTLSWLFYELARHPETVRRLQEEIESHVGLHRTPTYDDLKNMRFLQHTLNETLRLYPVVPYNVRIALTDTSLPRGGGKDGTEPIGIAKDTPIGYTTLLLHQREDIYPPASPSFPHHTEWAPERWDNWTPKSWTYIPFNGGPRICIGQQFALTEMAYTVVRILQAYERVESRQDEFPMFRTDIVLMPAKGVKVALFARK